MIKSKKICYFLKSGREKRIIDNHPDEFLYGLNFFRKKKLNVSVIHDNDLNFENSLNSKVYSLLNMIIYWLIGIPGKSLIILFSKRKLFSKYDVIILTTNSFGLSLAFLKKVGLFKPDIFYIAMGVITNKTPIIWIFVYRWILKGCKIVTLSKQDSKFLEKALNYKIDYINFGVDKDFWTPSKNNISKKYVISIGNDFNRDYKTLINVWRDDFPLLKIVTNHKVKTNKNNVEVIYGDWAKQALSDKLIRKLIRESLFVILPILDTVQPSGQSVALQSMSCGKTVLITNFMGLWNRELIQNFENMVLLGKPGEKNKIEAIISNVINKKKLLGVIGENARNIIETKLNSEKMAKEMLKILDNYIIMKSLNKS